MFSLDDGTSPSTLDDLSAPPPAPTQTDLPVSFFRRVQSPEAGLFPVGAQTALTKSS